MKLLLHPLTFFWLLLLCVVISVNSDKDDSDEEDFIPRFFGGRRNDEKSGIAPPPRTGQHQRSRGLTSLKCQIKYFEQRLDHFDKENIGVWQQRYFLNDAHFKPRPNGPIFVIVGGENELYESFVTDGPMARLAEKHQALIVALEHRFYGESRPTKDTSLKNLALLSSRQALADLNEFIKSQKKAYKCKNPNAKVILYGCSYSGTLVTFFQGLYPGLAIGALSTFAPAVAIEDYKDYFEGITSNIYKQNPSCGEYFEAALWGLRTLLNKKDQETMHALLNLCEPVATNFSNPSVIDSIFYDMISKLMMAAQYNQVHLGENAELASLCRIMTDDKTKCGQICDKYLGSESFTAENFYCCFLEKYARWLREYDGTCVVHNGNSIITRSIRWDQDYVKRGARQWLWQMCSEFGYFITIDSKRFEGILKIDLNYMQKTCRDSFGITNVTENVERTNTFYNEYIRKGAKSILFFISTMDPWSKSHILFHHGQHMPYGDVQVVVLNDVSHCYEPAYDGLDPPELIDAWKKADQKIGEWLSSGLVQQKPDWGFHVTRSRWNPGIFQIDQETGRSIWFGVTVVSYFCAIYFAYLTVERHAVRINNGGPTTGEFNSFEQAVVTFEISFPAKHIFQEDDYSDDTANGNTQNLGLKIFFNEDPTPFSPQSATPANSHAHIVYYHKEQLLRTDCQVGDDTTTPVDPEFQWPQTYETRYQSSRGI